MHGYQPKMRCDSCTKQNDCKKYKYDKIACKKYEGKQPMPPVKPAKQRTVLSVRDFAILYDIASRELTDMEVNIRTLGIDRETANRHPRYQDLLRIREKLGELNIEVETPIVEVKE